MSYTRFAIYYAPPQGTLAEFGAAWLGWDLETGQARAQPSVPGLGSITRTPRKYGFHGTLKPPFRLAEGQGFEALVEATATCAKATPRAICDGVTLTALGQFLALTPVGDMAAIGRVASRFVQELDRFRAPASEAELARRRAAGLTPRQEALLNRWGYPYVMDAFRFHLTLSGKLDPSEIAKWTDIARDHLPAMPMPFVVDQIALAGERKDGNFELIHRYALTG